MPALNACILQQFRILGGLDEPFVVDTQRVNGYNATTMVRKRQLREAYVRIDNINGCDSSEGVKSPGP